MKRAVGYVRVSTDDQIGNESPDIQRDAIAECITQNGWVLIKNYEDLGLSGYDDESRPGFMAMIQGAKNKEFDFVVIKDISRFGRNLLQILGNSKLLEDLGVGVVSISQPVQKGVYGTFMSQLFGGLAELERKVIMDRTQSGKMKKWKRGEIFPGRQSFGYRFDKELKALVPKEVEAELYKRIVSMFLDQGMSQQRIAIKLNEEGLKCKSAGWCAQVIGHIFRNPVYYGECVMNKTSLFKDRKRRRDTEGKTITHENPQSDWINIKVQNPLITKTRWDAIQEKTVFNTHKSKRTTWSHDRWLRDLLICGRCGSKVSPILNGKLQYYVCYCKKAGANALKTLSKHKPNRKRTGGTFEKCDLPSARDSLIEHHVWNELMMVLTIGNFKEVMALFNIDKIENQVEAAEMIIKGFERELKRKETAKSNLDEMLEDENFDKNEYLTKTRKNKEEILTLKAKLTDALAEKQTILETKSQYKAIESFSKNVKLRRSLHEQFQAFDADDRKRLFEGLIDGKITVDWMDITKEDHLGDYDDWKSTPEHGEVVGKSLKLDFQIRWNPMIFQYFADNGKLKVFANNACEDCETLIP